MSEPVDDRPAAAQGDANISGEQPLAPRHYAEDDTPPPAPPQYADAYADGGPAYDLPPAPQYGGAQYGGSQYGGAQYGAAHYDPQGADGEAGQQGYDDGGAMQRWFDQQQPAAEPGAYPIPPRQPSSGEQDAAQAVAPSAAGQAPAEQPSAADGYPDQTYGAPQGQTQGYAEQQGYPQQQGYAQQEGFVEQRGYAPYPPEAAQQPAQPPALPSPEDLLVPGQTASVEPASWGWRGKLNRGSGGLLKSKPKPAELEMRDAHKRITRSFSRPMTVVVVQPKGGAGKTPTTVCLSAAFGATRGGYVVGWDDNETRGTLSVRVENPDQQQSTVWDLLSDLPAFERYDARVGDLSYYVRSQPDAHFDALVSDDNPSNMAQIGDEAFQRLHTVMQRFYRLIVVDTGNNVRSPNWQAAVNAADLVVVVSTYQRDVGFSGSWVLDHLAQTGREELARNAVTVLTAGDPTVDKDVRAQLMEHFTARTRAVVEIPYDAELAHGGPIRWTALSDATRNAWIKAGATVVDALGEHDSRTLVERRQ